MINIMQKAVPILLGLSILGTGVGLYLAKINDCGNSTFCYFLFSRVGDPMFYGFGALAFVFVGLLFVPDAFSRWKKFAIWFVPLAALLFIWYPEPGSGDFFSPYPEQVFQWVSSFYVIASYSLIGLSLRKKN